MHKTPPAISRVILVLSSILLYIIKIEKNKAPQIDCASCPLDRFKSSSFVCRPPTGLCDVPEFCDGQGS